MLTDSLIVGMGAALSVAGYLCARRMSRGLTYYIGRTSVPEPCDESGTAYATIQQEKPEIETVRRLAAELEIAKKIQREMFGESQSLIIKYNLGGRWSLLSRQSILRRDWPEPSFPAGEDQPEPTEAALQLQRKQIHELERRVRALEEKISQPAEESTEPFITKAIIH